MASDPQLALRTDLGLAVSGADAPGIDGGSAIVGAVGAAGTADAIVRVR